jgi:8-oxo-dGTP diphosphatase
VKKQAATIIFIDSSNRVLLFLRDNKPSIPFPNSWDLLGGAMEPGETPEQCIIREMYEEIEFDLKSPTLFKTYDLPDRIDHLFWQCANIDIQNTTLHEGQKLGWFSEEQIRSMPEGALAFGFRNLLLEFYRERPFKPNNNLGPQSHTQY